MTDRGLSTVLSYVFALAITAALVAGLLAATGALVEDRSATTARAGLEVAGERLAANLMAADRLAIDGTDTVVVETALPDRVAGTGYTVTVNASATQLELETAATGTEVTVQVANRTDLVATSVRGGDIEVVNTTAGLEVRPA